MLYALAATIFGFYGSYIGFQKDTSKQVDKIEFRVDALEKTVTRDSSRIDDKDKGDADVNIRLDRLEHRR